ncbi:hypothetical protein DFJ74DRAFT_681677 [Hyaloraphidium curvatum]|nr:hypothetical protein DFJ74DRAFT_681677 [Hyaloraphidium curvatum]
MADLTALVIKATDETNTSEDWGTIVDIMDRARGSDERCRAVVRALVDRLASRNGNVVMYAVVVADSLVKNCGPAGQKEVASRAFLDALVKRIADRDLHDSLRQRILDNIQQWATAMKADPSLGYMADVYGSLKAQGYRFPEAAAAPAPGSKPAAAFAPPKSAPKTTKEEEDEELQLAVGSIPATAAPSSTDVPPAGQLALSLSEFESRASSTSNVASRAPVRESAAPVAPKPSSRVLFQVRALYDFAGDASQGELSLTRGDIVDVTDTTFKDWWRGELRGAGASGVFPQNYTEKIREEPKVDLNLEREVLEGSRNVELFLKVLGEVDPRNENLSENEKLQERYRDMLIMRPKVIKLIEFYSRRKDELLALSEQFSKAQQSYQSLLQGALAQHRSASYYSAAPAGPPPPGHEYGAPPPQQYDYGYQQQYPSY